MPKVLKDHKVHKVQLELIVRFRVIQVDKELKALKEHKALPL